MTKRHKVFVSFHHEDQEWKNRFVKMMGDSILNQSVDDGDIDDQLRVGTIRQNIREGFIVNATVTVVLIGICTWQRKHVDWEISYSLRKTQNKDRCGLLGILLPSHPDYDTGKYHPNLVPPRLAANSNDSDSYAAIYSWSTNPNTIQQWIHDAYNRRNRLLPDNSEIQFAHNRARNCEDGWN